MFSVKSHVPNYEREQFFFSDETLTNLEKLVLPGRIACLCTPTVHEHLLSIGRDTTLFDIDERMLKLFEGSAVRLDLKASAGSQIDPALFNSFQTVIIDPPFDTVKLKDVAERVRELLDYSSQTGRVVLTHQVTRKPIIEKVFGQGLGLVPNPELKTPIRYDSRFDEFLTPIQAFVFDKPEY